MTTSYGLHPDALLEYAEAANRYLQDASVRVADRFVTAVESASLRWSQRRSVVEELEIRRYVLGHFPFVLAYRWEPQRERVIIYAMMHTSREPGYRHQRL